MKFFIKLVSTKSRNLKTITLTCSDLKQARARILELLPDPHHDIPKVETALKLYLAVLRGFLEPPSNANKQSGEESNASGGTRASKLQHAVRFRWSQSMLGTSSPEAQNDAAFEVCYDIILLLNALNHFKGHPHWDIHHTLLHFRQQTC